MSTSSVGRRKQTLCFASDVKPEFNPPGHCIFEMVGMGALRSHPTVK